MLLTELMHLPMEYVCFGGRGWEGGEGRPGVIGISQQASEESSTSTAC